MSVEVGQVLDQPTLADLRETINRGHEALEATLTDALRQALIIGDALLSAKEMIPPGGFCAWRDANCSFSREAGRRYMLVAEKRSGIPENVTSLKQAMAFLGAHGAKRSKGIDQLDPDVRRDIQRLLDEGCPVRQIARRVGVSANRVYSIRDPRFAARRAATEKARAARRRAAEVALRAREQDKAVRATPFSVVWAEIHALTDHVGAFAHNAATREHRAVANAALAKLHEARDEIVKGLGL